MLAASSPLRRLGVARCAGRGGARAAGGAARPVAAQVILKEQGRKQMDRLFSAGFDFDGFPQVGRNSDDPVDRNHVDSRIHFLFPSLASERLFAGLAA